MESHHQMIFICLSKHYSSDVGKRSFLNMKVTTSLLCKAEYTDHHNSGTFVNLGLKGIDAPPSLMSLKSSEEKTRP